MTIACLSLIGFLIITILVLTNEITSFDTMIGDGVLNLRNPLLTAFFTNFTHIGDTIPVIIITIILLLAFYQWRDRILILSSVAATVGLNQGIKHMIERPRPPLDIHLISQGGFSFPSGHSMISLCMGGVLIYFVWTKLKKKNWKVFWTILLTILILLIGFSRIYVGVHYPSDVLGGYCLSLFILLIVISLVRDHFKGESKNDKDDSL